MAENRFADPDTAAADDGGDFLTNEELIGRHVIVVAKEIETIKGEGAWPDGREKTDYDRITGDIIILDGRKISKISSYPHLERGKYISSKAVVHELKKYVGTGTPVLGYWTMNGKAYFLDPTTDSDVVVKAERALDRYEAANGQQAQPQDPPF